jgi:hypothetical protein
VKDCMPILTGRLQDTGDTEDSALGACRVLMSRPILRHLMQDWSDLVRFLLALLNSSHHDSVKAQTAINELFIVFNVRSGGLRVSSLSHTEEQPEAMTYTGLINHIKNRLADGALNIHWRCVSWSQILFCSLLVFEVKAVQIVGHRTCSIFYPSVVFLFSSHLQLFTWRGATGCVSGTI